jgi:hypothetical protein
VLPDVIVRKASLLLAVQVQPAACDATVTVPWPPAEENEKVAGVTDKSQVTRLITISMRRSDESATVCVADS